MFTDPQYLSSCGKSFAIVSNGVKGNWDNVPDHYLDFFHHKFENGDISLLPLFPLVENTEDLTQEELQSVVGVLSRVDLNEWPDADSIESIDALMALGDSQKESLNFVEDNLGTSEKISKVLKSVIEDTFGSPVSTIRSKSGSFPDPGNHFLMEKDGTFAGTFKYGKHVFQFEIVPTEKGWICTYRLNEKSLDKIDRIDNFRKKRTNPFQKKRVRRRGW